MSAALYVGSVMHQRLRPWMHPFRYRCFWILFNLDEVQSLSSRVRLVSYNRFNVFSFHDGDFGNGSGTPLREQIASTLKNAAIDLDGGTIHLLCMPRVLGFAFNPLSIYFCSRADGTTAALVYEVHNTFGERHSYVLPVRSPSGTIRHACRKSFYVSPFIDMDMRYDFAVMEPNERVAVAIRTSKAGQVVMVARLAGRRFPITDRTLARLFFAIPLVTLKVIAAIHWQALRLWLGGLRIRERPSSQPAAGSPAEPRQGVSEVR
jgi:DUF1365 family protein